MRTTVNLPDDVADVARALASAKDMSLGDAIAELVRRGLAAHAQPLGGKSFPCFAVAPSAPPITLERTLAAEDEA